MIDNTHNSVVNRVNIASMLLDGVHPTIECYKVMARELAEKITYK
jgi:lysophospholipase L1-like esterase